MQALIFRGPTTARVIGSGITQHLSLPIPESVPTVGTDPLPCEGVGIGPLVFRCPATGHNIESGIDMDLQTFRRIGHLSVRLRCRGCDHPHELKVADGCLASYRMPPCAGDLCRPDVSAEEHTMH